MVSLSLGVGGLPPLSGLCGGHAGGQLGDRGLGVLFLLCVARGGDDCVLSKNKSGELRLNLSRS